MGTSCICSAYDSLDLHIPVDVKDFQRWRVSRSCLIHIHVQINFNNRFSIEMIKWFVVCSFHSLRTLRFSDTKISISCQVHAVTNFCGVGHNYSSIKELHLMSIDLVVYSIWPLPLLKVLFCSLFIRRIQHIPDLGQQRPMGDYHLRTASYAAGCESQSARDLLAIGVNLTPKAQSELIAKPIKSEFMVTNSEWNKCHFHSTEGSIYERYWSILSSYWDKWADCIH